MPVNDQTPNVILMDSTENFMEVSGGVAVGTGTKGILFTGVQSNGTGSFFLADSSGRMTVTGTLTVANTLTVTGSVGITNFPVSQSVTGTVSLSGVSTVTGSITVPNMVTVTGSITVPNTVTVTGSVGVAQPDLTATAALGALNAAVTLTLTGSQGVGFQLAAGTLVGTIIAEISYDGGSTWGATGFLDVDTKGYSDSITFAASNGALLKEVIVFGGSGQARVRVSAFTSGTASGQLRASQVTNRIAITSAVDGQRPTYGAVTAAFASAATPTDIFTITGSATKIIRILKIQLYATQTVLAQSTVFLIKRSTANTAGTAVAATRVPFNSLSAAATATVQSYTANPTVGTLIGNVQAYRGIIPAPTTVTEGILATWEFGNRPGQAVILRTAAENLCVNLGGVTVTGGSFIITVEWTEE